jgi:asparagine synthase (glutamine-hydrolysing)
MCGVCGILAAPGRNADERAVEAMTRALIHRGPDSGSVTPLGSCALGIRRLAVIDLVTGDQPFTSEAEDLTVVANGEIYNFRELRRELEGAGHVLRGTNDVALLPHLYEEHGLGFAERLSGMYAIALWDARRKRLVLVRDRLGKKPLLYARLPDGSLAFASELKALARLPGLDRTLDLEAIDAYLALQYVPSPATALAGVSKVPPGCFLVAEQGEVRVERYWSPTVRSERLDEPAWLERVRTTVRDAVERRLVADVPLGVLLSGGIDSSVVVSQVAQLTRQPVRTFSVGFLDRRYDERALARLVAERWRTEHREYLVEESATDLLPRLAVAVDEPLGDASALPTLIVCEHAAQDVTVALTGDGGDESFGGYERYAAVRLAGQVGRLPSSLLHTAAAAARRLPGGRQDLRSPLVRAARFLEVAAAPSAERYGRLMELFPVELRRRLWTTEAAVGLRLPPTGELLAAPPVPGIAGLQLVDLATYLPGDLLRKADLTSMATSLELRSPLLDSDVVELGLSLPDSLKLARGSGKIALRRAFAAELPAEVASAPKRGFGVPLATWFAGPVRELAGDVLLDARSRGRGLFRTETIESMLRAHADGREDHGHRLWALLMLELWQRRYVDEVPAPVPDLVAARG